MADQIWSTDADVHLHRPDAFRALAESMKHLVEGTDGATDSTGKILTSAAIGSGFVTAGVGLDSLSNNTTHFLEILSGAYQGLYKIATVAASSLALNRQIGASLTGLEFRVRSFSDYHDEAHLHYQDIIKRRENDEDWADDELHARSVRLLRDLCVYRVLALVCRAATSQPDDNWAEAAKLYESKELEAFASLGHLEKDTDDDGEADEITSENIGSIEMEIS